MQGHWCPLSLTSVACWAHDDDPGHTQPPHCPGQRDVDHRLDKGQWHQAWTEDERPGQTEDDGWRGAYRSDPSDNGHTLRKRREILGHHRRWQHPTTVTPWGRGGRYWATTGDDNIRQRSHPEEEEGDTGPPQEMTTSDNGHTLRKRREILGHHRRWQHPTTVTPWGRGGRYWATTGDDNIRQRSHPEEEEGDTGPPQEMTTSDNGHTLRKRREILGHHRRWQHPTTVTPWGRGGRYWATTGDDNIRQRLHPEEEEGDTGPPQEMTTSDNGHTLRKRREILGHHRRWQHPTTVTPWGRGGRYWATTGDDNIRQRLHPEEEEGDTGPPQEMTTSDNGYTLRKRREILGHHRRWQHPTTVTPWGRGGRYWATTGDDNIRQRSHPEEEEGDIGPPQEMTTSDNGYTLRKRREILGHHRRWQHPTTVTPWGRGGRYWATTGDDNIRQRLHPEEEEGDTGPPQEMTTSDNGHTLRKRREILGHHRRWQRSHPEEEEGDTGPPQEMTTVTPWGRGGRYWATIRQRLHPEEEEGDTGPPSDNGYTLRKRREILGHHPTTVTPWGRGGRYWATVRQRLHPEEEEGDTGPPSDNGYTLRKRREILGHHPTTVTPRGRGGRYWATTGDDNIRQRLHPEEEEGDIGPPQEMTTSDNGYTLRKRREILGHHRRWQHPTTVTPWGRGGRYWATTGDDNIRQRLHPEEEEGDTGPPQEMTTSDNGHTLRKRREILGHHRRWQHPTTVTPWGRGGRYWATIRQRSHPEEEEGDTGPPQEMTTSDNGYTLRKRREILGHHRRWQHPTTVTPWGRGGRYWATIRQRSHPEEEEGDTGPPQEMTTSDNGHTLGKRREILGHHRRWQHPTTVTPWGRGGRYWATTGDDNIRQRLHPEEEEGDTGPPQEMTTSDNGHTLRKRREILGHHRRWQHPTTVIPWGRGGRYWATTGDDNIRQRSHPEEEEGDIGPPQEMNIRQRSHPEEEEGDIGPPQEMTTSDNGYTLRKRREILGHHRRWQHPTTVTPWGRGGRYWAITGDDNIRQRSHPEEEEGDTGPPQEMTTSYNGHTLRKRREILGHHRRWQHPTTVTPWGRGGRYWATTGDDNIRQRLHPEEEEGDIGPPQEMNIRQRLHPEEEEGDIGPPQEMTTSDNGYTLRKRREILGHHRRWQHPTTVTPWGRGGRYWATTGDDNIRQRSHPEEEEGDIGPP